MNLKDPAWLDSMYNNRNLVPDYASYFDNWVHTSQAARSSQPCMLDVAYGTSGGETLDVFSTSTKSAPVMVFIHGGYWRSLDKSDHSFVAPAFTAQGACVVVVNYDLCPAVTIPEITLQMVRALSWVYRNIAQHGGDPKRITVVGHSAGGHLAAMMLACVWKAYAADLPADLVKNALSISGLYDLEPLRHAPNVKDSLKLTPAQVRKASPALLPAPRQGTLYSVAGGIESAEFLRHNRLIQQAWGNKTVPVCEELPGLHHFSVMDALLDPKHRLHQLAQQLIAATA
jgi:arylformamidase